MSAYAALQGGQLFDDEDSETMIQYDKSSDEEVPEEAEQDSLNQTARSSIPPRPQTITCTNNNFILKPEGVLIGLRVNESVTVSGQFILAIERGSILINGVEYYHAPQTFKIIQPRLTNLLTISSTQVVNTDEVVDIKTEDNEHLFSSDFKAAIRIKNLSTGLEGITKYYLPFKNLFKLRDDSYSFDVIFNIDEGILFSPKEISNIIPEPESINEPITCITVGNKNSGKSTIAKLLINKLITSTSPVSLLDLDPGQSEYSNPYCLSITNHDTPIHGFNYHQDPDNDLHCYYGFSSPQSNPELYLKIIEHLFNYYSQVLQQKGHHLVINTPGWVKGFGKKLLADITKLINPQYMILLTSNITDNEDILSDLTYQQLKVIKGSFQQSKYSPMDFRIFNKLVYFHQLGKLEYDFSSHLLATSPLKISYQTSEGDTNSDSGFTGINLVSVLNNDLVLNFNWDDLYLMLDMSIVGIYLIEDEYFHANSNLINYSSCGTKLPYLNGSDYNHLIEYNSLAVRYFGVALMHSINTIDKYFNIYFSPNQEINTIKNLLQNGFKLLIVKGESDIPSCEVLMPQLLEQFRRSYKKSFKTKQPLPSYPYVNFNNKINGVWKARRNVLRRNQQ